MDITRFSCLGVKIKIKKRTMCWETLFSHSLLVTRPHETLMFFVAGLFKSASPTSDSPPPKLLKCRAAQKIQNRRHCFAFSFDWETFFDISFVSLLQGAQSKYVCIWTYETILFKTKIQKKIWVKIEFVFALLRYLKSHMVGGFVAVFLMPWSPLDTC